MMQNPTRYLIVNADDFGLTAGINRGIIHAHQKGIVTSTSLMVRQPAAEEAAALAAANPSLSVGLHVELAEWVYENDAWVCRYEVVPPDDSSSVAEEVDRQLKAFHEQMGRPPSHLDSHQHMHRDDPLKSILLQKADELKVPLRSFTPIVEHCGSFYGQDGKGEPWPEMLEACALVELLRNLQPGVTEIGCHPGFPEGLKSVYCFERRLEIQALCDPTVRRAIADGGIRLCSFAELGSINHQQSLQAPNSGREVRT